jgi:hypothetical protein
MPHVDFEQFKNTEDDFHDKHHAKKSDEDFLLGSSYKWD